MATKAVHLELASDMTSSTFIAALNRMIARRGIPKNIYSDNGTNFVGANRELKKEFKPHSTFGDNTLEKISHLEITWHFNSTLWPNAGGLWEAAVKSMKKHLKRTIGEQKLTFEELTTLLTRIEACLNSRPLLALTEDPEDIGTVLTPGHFLIGEPLLTLPQQDLTDEKCPKTRWQLTTKLLQSFWKTSIQHSSSTNMLQMAETNRKPTARRHCGSEGRMPAPREVGVGKNRAST